MQISIPTKNGVGRSEALTPERLVNMYVTASPQGAIGSGYIEGIPGTILRGTAGDGPIRGMRRMAGALYVVSSTLLYSVNSAFTATSLGTIEGTGRVWMADNGTQLCIVVGAKGYIYTVAGGLVEITDTDFPGADTVAYLDGYFIYNSPSTGQFFISNLYDGTIYDATDFASAESYPDPLLAVFVDHRELFLFGDETVEVWFNSGAADFPFERAQGASIEKGVGAVDSIAKVDNSVFWLDHQGVVRRLAQGYTPLRISTHSVEYDISRGNWESAYAYTYTQEGHEFYSLTVPGAGTYVYDASTGEWHERNSFGLLHHRMGFYVYCYGRHLVGDTINGRIYELDFDTETENGEVILAEMIFPQLRVEDADRFRVNEFQLDMEVGVGLTTGQGSAPLAMLQTSRDGGRTWGNNEMTASLGAIGEYETRVRWNRLGQFRSFTPRVRISDPVQRAVYTAYVSVLRDR
jgi:hypothetical protein